MSNPYTGERYEDAFGDWWKRISDTHVMRLHDRMVGLWDKGRGLQLVKENLYKH